MAPPPLPPEALREAVALVEKHGSILSASQATGMAYTTLRDRYNRGLALASAIGSEAPPADPDDLTALRSEIKLLQAELKAAEKERLTARVVRKLFLGLAEEAANPPAWIIERDAIQPGSPGVPSVNWSDWHWGEKVFPEQIAGVNNRFDLRVAHERARTILERTLDLCFNHVRNPSYPGIVVNLGGDMLTGDIHKELLESNDAPTIPALLDLFGVLITMLTKLADEFGRVLVCCVIGNHDRNTQKFQFKNATYTSLSWALYCLLERHFQHDQRLVFLIPDGFDCYYEVQGKRYLLQHGDRMGVRGGDGHVGVIGPIVRGTQKLRKQYAAIGRPVDMVILGHWHTFLNLPGVRVNGSLKGYDEFAMGNRFDPEPAAQMLWFTHPRWGIGEPIRVFADEPEIASDTPWSSWPAEYKRTA